MPYLSKPNTLSNKPISGFTLVELMIVVSIIGVLASAAYPSYLESVFKGKRSTATASVLECVALLERRFTLTSTYTDDACNNLNNADYTISIDVSMATRNGRACTANSRENCFEVTATSQIIADDACQALTINELGVKATVPAANVTKCWRTT
ncbi:MAG: type IV pilus assembly protein PilE [Arenicella sp.]|jgi:type IV pilus assembly protein PilE